MIVNSNNSSNSSKANILILEDSLGVAFLYKELLKKRYPDPNSVKICKSGQDAKSLINEGCKFDLVIMDIVLPPEDIENLTLEDCQETGLRLMDSMIKNNICRRFYVITVRKDLGERVKQLCERGKKVILKFEPKLDHDPEKFSDNIAALLATDI